MYLDGTWNRARRAQVSRSILAVYAGGIASEILSLFHVRIINIICTQARSVAVIGAGKSCGIQYQVDNWLMILNGCLGAVGTRSPHENLLASILTSRRWCGSSCLTSGKAFQHNCFRT